MYDPVLNVHTVGKSKKTPTSDGWGAGSQKHGRGQQDFVQLWMGKSDNDQDHRTGACSYLVPTMYCTLMTMFVAAYLQYRRGNQLI